MVLLGFFHCRLTMSITCRRLYLFEFGYATFTLACCEFNVKHGYLCTYNNCMFGSNQACSSSSSSYCMCELKHLALVLLCTILDLKLTL